MALFDFKKTVKGLSKVAQDVSKDVVKKAQSIDYEQLAKDVTIQTSKAVNGMADTLKNTKPEDIATNLGRMAENGGRALNKFIKDATETDKAVKEVLEEKEDKSAEVSLEEALLVMYLMNNIDQDYSDEEKDIYSSILEYSDADVETCVAVLKEGKEIVQQAYEEDFEDVIIEKAVEILKRDNPSSNTINKKLFIWNLLTLAKCDNDYAEEEQRLLRTVIRTLGVKKEVFTEMEACYDAMKELEKATSEDIFYNKELKHRKDIINQSILQLISDKEV